MSSQQRKLYPLPQPYKIHDIAVSDRHTLYVEESGNPNGQPAVFLHGGPGGGTSPEHRGFFDPQHYRIILIDQRGCGKSRPHADLNENTTWDLVEDLEKIRRHLKIEQWLVFGGSWGSTLALAYASRYPEAITHLVLRGIFLCRDSELKWFYQAGASDIFPEAWQSYLQFIPADERHDLMKAYHQRLLSSDENLRLAAAKHWSKWEASCSKLYIDTHFIEEYEDPHKALAFARIESHYFQNKAFFNSPNFLIEQVPRYRNIPAIIIQGRYDMVCPIRSAWDLHQAWHEAKLEIVADAGHSAFEPGITTALVNATDAFRESSFKS